MASKDRAKYNEYMRGYVLDRYITFMANVIAAKGGVCSRCGGTDRLQLHHRDPKEKSFTIARGWSHSKEEVDQELEKCDLLCYACHRAEHSAKQKHGTITSYKHCKCDECRRAKNEYMREYRKTHPRNGRITQTVE